MIKCEICCRQFESVSELKYHFEICKKGLECNNCPKSFETVESFKEHSNICDGVNTYRCFVCGKKFESDINCLTHTKNAVVCYLVKDVIRCVQLIKYYCNTIGYFMNKLIVIFVKKYFMSNHNYWII